ncbi:MAG: phage tail sheath family protein, partial [Dechloromonas agitata]|nr:phage tail sheath family protein [Dechloromonas agitata]
GEQAALNSDTAAGKSINAIRQFPGRGWLVWGARTLAGNDAEWRYVSVRRFCNMVETSIRQAAESFVFEPNDAATWHRLSATVDNYLVAQWRAGALLGSRPEEAFFVRCGLGQTMTAQDIAAGRLIFEIGLALVRPAEFIVLRSMLQMSES